MASTFLTRAAEIRQANPGMKAVDAAKQARAEISTPVATPGAPATKANGLVSSTTTNPDGTVSIGASVNTPVKGVMTTSTDNLDTTISNAQSTPSAVSVPGASPSAVSPVASSPSVTSSPSSNKPVGSAAAGTTGKTDSTGTTIDTVSNDASNSYTEDKKTDAAQLVADTKAIEDATTATNANLENQRLQKENDAIEENNRQIARTNEDATLQRQQDSEYRAKQQKNLEALDAKHKQAENALAIANDVALQQSNVLFAKLGLSLSTAGVTTAQQIYTTGIYNLSKLKADDAYDYANLHEQVAKTEFEHTTAVNKLIRDSEDKTYKLRQTLNADVFAIKNSIIANNAAKQVATSALLDKYQKARNDNEEAFIKKMTDASKAVIAKSDSIWDTLKKKNTYNQDIISDYVNTGRWANVQPQEQVRLERLAGWLPGTAMGKIKEATAKLITKQTSEMLGTGINIAAGDYAHIQKLAEQYQSMGRSMTESVNLAISEYANKSPSYKAAMAKYAKERSSGLGKNELSNVKDGQLINYTIMVDGKKLVKTGEHHAGKGGTEGYVLSGGNKISLGDVTEVSVAKNSLLSQ